MMVFRMQSGKRFLLIAFLVIAFIVPSMAMAESSNGNQPSNISSTAIGEPVVVSAFNAMDAKVESREGRHIVVSENVYSGTGIQTNVRLGVRIFKLLNDDGDGYPVATIFDTNTANVGSDPNFRLKFAFDMPEYLSYGEYLITVLAGTSAGLMFNENKAGIVAVGDDFDEKGLVINPSDCYLEVSGDQNRKHYGIGQGVDISSDESLRMLCNVQNLTQKEISFKPVFETYKEGMVSGVIEDAVMMDSEQLSIAAGESKLVSINLPKAKLPQLYTVVSYFVDDAGVRVSQGIESKYVIHGKTAYFQNILFDNNSYKSGDTTNIQVFWSPWVQMTNPRIQTADDRWDNVNGTIEATLSDANGSSCADPLSISLGNNRSMKQLLSFNVKSDCLYPMLTLRLFDKATGEIFDTASVEFKEIVGQENDNGAAADVVSEGQYSIITSILILFFVLLVMLLAKYRKFHGVLKVFIGLCVLYGAAIGSVSVASADDGSCGAANRFIFPDNETAYGTNVLGVIRNQCNSGTSSDTSFPAQGEMRHQWECLGTNGGRDAMCYAGRNGGDSVYTSYCHGATSCSVGWTYYWDGTCGDGNVTSWGFGTHLNNVPKNAIYDNGDDLDLFASSYMNGYPGSGNADCDGHTWSSHAYAAPLSVESFSSTFDAANEISTFSGSDLYSGHNGSKEASMIIPSDTVSKMTPAASVYYNMHDYNWSPIFVSLGARSPLKIDGVCGGADGHIFKDASTDYTKIFNQCDSGTGDGVFPNAGESHSYVCKGKNGGADSPQCTASHNTKPVVTNVQATLDTTQPDFTYTFVVTGKDADSAAYGDEIRFGFDWDRDENIDQWTGFVSSNSSATLAHAMPNKKFDITVYAQDRRRDMKDFNVWVVLDRSDRYDFSNANNGVCGTANGKRYDFNVDSYENDTMCKSGNPDSRNFPGLGKTVAWKCVGENSSSNTCEASRKTLSLFEGSDTSANCSGVGSFSLAKDIFFSLGSTQDYTACYGYTSSSNSYQATNVTRDADIVFNENTDNDAVSWSSSPNPKGVLTANASQGGVERGLSASYAPLSAGESQTFPKFGFKATVQDCVAQCDSPETHCKDTLYEDSCKQKTCVGTKSCNIKNLKEVAP